MRDLVAAWDAYGFGPSGNMQDGLDRCIELGWVDGSSTSDSYKLTDAGKANGHSVPPARPGELSGRPAPSGDPRSIPAWVLRHRIAMPPQPDDYVERPALLARCSAEGRRAVLLVAPGGFGKTTLLAAYCRNAAAAGTPVAWLTLDEGDDAAAFDIYLAYAFERAGFDIGARLRRSGADLPFSRTALLPQLIAESGKRCVLALDELERLADPGAAAILDNLLRRAPAQLSLAVACRELPAQVDLAPVLLDGSAELLDAEDLRFSKSEIASFFHLGLSRRQLARVAERSSGWPIMLRLAGAETSAGESTVRVTRRAMVNWIATRLWHGVADEDRELILDVGLFESFDAELLDDVLEQTGTMARLAAISPLAGLVERLSADGTAEFRLHPLVREHCVAERRSRSPARYRAVCGRLAAVLASRGRVIDGVRSALQGGDSALAGRILVGAGGLRLWLRHGAGFLLAADRVLTPSSQAVSPRLALLRCVAAVLDGRFVEARRAVRDTLAALPGPPDPALAVDACLARTMLCLSGCELTRSAESRAVFAEAERIAGLETEEPVTRAVMEFTRCVAHSAAAEFRAARDCAARAGRLAGTSPYVAMAVDFQQGIIEMAQGRPEEAEDRYAQGRRAARACFVEDPAYALFGDVLARELALERNRATDAAEARRLQREVYRRGTLWASYVAAAEGACESTLDEDGPQAAVAVADAAWKDARAKGLLPVERVLSGLRVSLRVRAGDAGAAERVWRADALPSTDAACTDIGIQSWREMEAVASARIRLLAGQGAFEAARAVAADLHREAARVGLRRTAMRALALAMRTEYLAGARDAAVARLAAFLALFAETGYARAAVIEGEITARTAERFLDAHERSPLAVGAARLLNATRPRPVPTPTLTAREAEILAQLETARDKQIAARLGLTPDGVRYHLRRIYGKLHVHSRTDAVRRAKELGLLS